jgi:opacity protein-like surface antigen
MLNNISQTKPYGGKNMKKSLFLVGTLLVAGMWSAPVQAADHYVSGFGGVSWINEGDTDAGMTGTAAIGCDYGDTRLEAEFGYQHGSTTVLLPPAPAWKYAKDIYSLMANGYYDVDLGGVDLYGTVGLGVAQVDTGTYPHIPPSNIVDDDNVSLAYQLGVGLAVPVGSGVSVDAKYRYFSTLDNNQLSSHSALLGLRVGL